MKIKSEDVYEEHARLIYWTRITFLSDDEIKRSIVIAAASLEYLQDFYSANDLKDKHFKNWIERVTQKWESLDDTILKQKIHYDVYTVSPEGEAKITDFLVNKQWKSK
jgi:hypothetical protein